MKRSWLLLGMGLTCVVCAGALAAEAPDGFKALFNGEDLTGWQGDPKLWRVENGEIVGSTEGVPPIEANTFLSTKETYGDFVLRIKVKLRNHNSGIQFRSEQSDNFVVSGYQADIAEQKYFGMLYEEKKRGFMPYWKALTPEEQTAVHAASKAGDWNDFVIRCEGDKIQMKLNGTVVCDIVDPEGAKSGVIALQLHRGDPMEVRFKDIYIKPIE
jgi:hypothetical protein